MQQTHVFGQTIFGKSFLDIYKCPFFIFPKNFPGKKHDILNNKLLEVLKEVGSGKWEVGPDLMNIC